MILLSLDKSSEYISIWFLISSLSVLINSCTSIFTQFFNHYFLALSLAFMAVNSNSWSFRFICSLKISISSKSASNISTLTTTSNYFLIDSRSFLALSLLKDAFSISYSHFFMSYSDTLSFNASWSLSISCSWSIYSYSSFYI